MFVSRAEEYEDFSEGYGGHPISGVRYWAKVTQFDNKLLN